LLGLLSLLSLLSLLGLLGLLGYGPIHVASEMISLLPNTFEYANLLH